MLQIECRGDALRRVPVVEIVELLPPGGVALRVRQVDLREVAYCLNDLVGRLKNRDPRDVSVYCSRSGTMKIIGLPVNAWIRK